MRVPNTISSLGLSIFQQLNAQLEISPALAPRPFLTSDGQRGSTVLANLSTPLGLNHLMSVNIPSDPLGTKISNNQILASALVENSISKPLRLNSQTIPNNTLMPISFLTKPNLLNTENNISKITEFFSATNSANFSGESSNNLQNIASLTNPAILPFNRLTNEQMHIDKRSAKSEILPEDYIQDNGSRRESNSKLKLRMNLKRLLKRFLANLRQK